MNNYQVMPADIKDWETIKNIYIEGIKTKNATFETACSVLTGEQWFNGKIPGSVFKIIDSNQIVLGWSALSSVSDRCVYGGVVEVSVYIADSAKGKGLGKQLLQSLIDFSENNNIWTLQAGIFIENKASIGLHKKLGFREVGIREKLGKLDGIWRDVMLLEKRSVTIL